MAIRKESNFFSSLINAGADLEARNKKGRTPLFNAIEFSYWCGADYLIKKGANLLVEDARGVNLLEFAKVRYTSAYGDIAREDTSSIEDVAREVMSQIEMAWKNRI